MRDTIYLTSVRPGEEAGAAMFGNGYDQYFRPNCKAAEEYKQEVHDEEDGEGRGKDEE